MDEDLSHVYYNPSHPQDSAGQPILQNQLKIRNMNRKQLRNSYNLKIHTYYTNLLGKGFLEINILFIKL